MAKQDSPNILTAALAGVLAWVVPGAGHVYLGRTFRGVVICIAINALFWGGMAVGGVFTVDPVGEPWWFAAQMCNGASGVAGWCRQDSQRQEVVDKDLGKEPRPIDRGRTGERQRWDKAFNIALDKRDLHPVYPASIVARAYTGVAGMLNIMCVFDAVMLGLLGRFGEPPPEEEQPETAEGDAPKEASEEEPAE